MDNAIILGLTARDSNFCPEMKLWISNNCNTEEYFSYKIGSTFATAREGSTSSNINIYAMF